ncbi:hypothetical protein KUTeg_021632, partial [Tegillarca granosa]
MKCKEGSIKIKSAMYGRQNKQSCKDANAKNINCSAGRAENKVKKQCDGKKQCNLQASNSVYGDPCPDKEIVCEGNVANMRCTEGTIKIHSAMYGRQDRQPCRDSNSNNINCSAGRAEDKVKNHCDGKTHCHLEASNSVYGDPCPGTSKYLEVHWTC